MSFCLTTYTITVTFSKISGGIYFSSLTSQLFTWLLSWSSRQLTEPGCSSATGSHSKSFDHSHYRPYQGGGGDSGDALSVTSVSSSGSDLEDVNASFLSDSPEGHERKVRKKGGMETGKKKHLGFCSSSLKSSAGCSTVWLFGDGFCFLPLAPSRRRLLP